MPQKEILDPPWLPLKPATILLGPARELYEFSGDVAVPINRTFRGRERKPVLTLHDLLLFNQTKRKYQPLRIHPLISILQRTVELRCLHEFAYIMSRERVTDPCFFFPHTEAKKKIVWLKTDGAFLKRLLFFFPFLMQLLFSFIALFPW